MHHVGYDYRMNAEAHWSCAIPGYGETKVWISHKTNMKARLAYILYRRLLKEFLEVKIVSSLAHDLVLDADSSSSEDDEIMFVLSELAVPAKELLGIKVNLEDFSSLQCEQLFRYVQFHYNFFLYIDNHTYL